MLGSRFGIRVGQPAKVDDATQGQRETLILANDLSRAGLTILENSLNTSLAKSAMIASKYNLTSPVVGISTSPSPSPSLIALASSICLPDGPNPNTLVANVCGRSLRL